MGADDLERLVSTELDTRNFDSVTSWLGTNGIHPLTQARSFDIYILNAPQDKQPNQEGRLFFAIRRSWLDPKKYNVVLLWKAPSFSEAVRDINSHSINPVSPEHEKALRDLFIPYCAVIAGTSLITIVGLGWILYDAAAEYLKAPPELRQAHLKADAIIAGLVILLGIPIYKFATGVEKRELFRDESVPEGFRKRLEGEEAVKVAVSYVTGHVR